MLQNNGCDDIFWYITLQCWLFWYITLQCWVVESSYCDYIGNRFKVPSTRDGDVGRGCLIGASRKVRHGSPPWLRIARKCPMILKWYEKLSKGDGPQHNDFAPTYFPPGRLVDVILIYVCVYIHTDRYLCYIQMISYIRLSQMGHRTGTVGDKTAWVCFTFPGRSSTPSTHRPCRLAVQKNLRIFMECNGWISNNFDLAELWAMTCGIWLSSTFDVMVCRMPLETSRVCRILAFHVGKPVGNVGISSLKGPTLGRVRLRSLCSFGTSSWTENIMGKNLEMQLHIWCVYIFMILCLY